MWSAIAPSNIAFIKYMGKSDVASNLPTNSSLSFTTKNLISKVNIIPHKGDIDIWRPLDDENFFTLDLNEFEQAKYLSHFSRIKELFGVRDNFIVESSNNFPSSTGIASSASSFAALTKAGVWAMCEVSGADVPDDGYICEISRLGSGSSCRSFFQPWALWNSAGVKELGFDGFNFLNHQLLIISSEKKLVSSSQAHQLVKTSLLFQGRPERAKLRLERLIGAMKKQDWKETFNLCWAEFMDMHALFVTCNKPFSYISSKSMAVLNFVLGFWSANDDGPVVTMDAGENIHIFWRPNQADVKKEFFSRLPIEDFGVIDNEKISGSVR